MKANLPLLLAGLVIMAATAHAATEPQAETPIVLPKYVVSTPRTSPVEQRINASLQALQQQAHAISLLDSLDPILPEIIASTPLTAAVGHSARARDSKS